MVMQIALFINIFLVARKNDRKLTHYFYLIFFPLYFPSVYLFASYMDGLRQIGFRDPVPLHDVFN